MSEVVCIRASTTDTEFSTRWEIHGGGKTKGKRKTKENVSGRRNMDSKQIHSHSFKAVVSLCHCILSDTPQAKARPVSSGDGEAS
jgi:hypothetical protein